MDENRITESPATEDSLPPEKPAEAQPSKKQLESRLISDYKKEARSEASLYLREKKAITDPESKKAFRRKWRQRKKEFRSELKKADSSEKKARKKARKIFLHRVGSVSRHWHSSLELLYVCEGKVQIIVGDRRCFLGPDDLILIKEPKHWLKHSIFPNLKP